MSSELYAYDSLNRLTNFSTGTLNISGGTASISGTPAETEGWSLDALGNWSSSTLNGVTTPQTYSAQNQIETIGSGGGTKLSYDANGNLLKDQNGQIFVYDAWNRMLEVEDDTGAVSATYTYDALNRRITETHDTASADLYYSNRDQVRDETGTQLVFNVTRCFDLFRTTFASYRM